MKENEYERDEKYAQHKYDFDTKNVPKWKWITQVDLSQTKPKRKILNGKKREIMYVRYRREQQKSARLTKSNKVASKRRRMEEETNSDRQQQQQHKPKNETAAVNRTACRYEQLLSCINSTVRCDCQCVSVVRMVNLVYVSICVCTLHWVSHRAHSIPLSFLNKNRVLSECASSTQRELYRAL